MSVGIFLLNKANATVLNDMSALLIEGDKSAYQTQPTFPVTGRVDMRTCFAE